MAAADEHILQETANLLYSSSAMSDATDGHATPTLPAPTALHAAGSCSHHPKRACRCTLEAAVGTCGVMLSLTHVRCHQLPLSSTSLSIV